MNNLRSIKIAGFKSIKDTGEAGIELRSINVLIGANGTGKSNLVSFFQMLNFMSTESLQLWVTRAGGASSLLHYGPKITPQISATLAFETPKGLNKYHLRLMHGAQDSLLFADEHLSFAKKGGDHQKPLEFSLGGGHRETLLKDALTQGGVKSATAGVFSGLLARTRVFHFHDTSDTARVKQFCYVEDNQFLKSDAGNLSARLLRLKNTRPKYYIRIVETVRQVAPFFDDFLLVPSDKDSILLRWQERGSDQVFGPHQLSDGTIRFMSLATLLLQPTEDLPEVIFVDEPELGLHPAAIQLLSELVNTAASHCQIIMTTQSPKLLDFFNAEDVVVVSRTAEPTTGRSASVFERLDPEKLHDWLAEFTLSELWNSNVIGGRPAT